MNSGNKKINADIYRLGQIMGLNKKDMNNILNNAHQPTEEYQISLGPKPYYATFYGTISINDFK
jgi:plasmid maintenance system antidote protein VapI